MTQEPVTPPAEDEPEGDGAGDPDVEGGDSNIEDDAGEADKGKA